MNENIKRNFFFFRIKIIYCRTSSHSYLDVFNDDYNSYLKTSVQEEFEDSKGVIKSVNRTRADNTMAKRTKQRSTKHTYKMSIFYQLAIFKITNLV